VMWQSYAWDSAGKNDRALATLPEVLLKPERLPYDFISRLIRCRVLAESDQAPAAIAMLIYSQKLLEDWFPQADKAALDTRRRLVAAVQWKITKDWAAGKSGSKVTPAQLDTILSGSREILSPRENANLAFHLDNAIPIIVEAPALHATQPDH